MLRAKTTEKQNKIFWLSLPLQHKKQTFLAKGCKAKGKVKQKKRHVYNFFGGGVSANSISNTHAAASGFDTDLYHFYLILPLHKGKRKSFKIQHILKRTNSTLKNKVIIRRWKTKHFNPLNPKNLASAKDCLVASSWRRAGVPSGRLLHTTWREMRWNCVQTGGDTLLCLDTLHVILWHTTVLREVKLKVSVSHKLPFQIYSL